MHDRVRAFTGAGLATGAHKYVLSINAVIHLTVESGDNGRSAIIAPRVSMRNFLTYTMSLLILMLNSMTANAIAKRVHVPKHCPVKAHRTAVEDNVFSSPDAQSDVLPGFVGKKGQPLNAEMEPKLPGFEHTRLLSDLTKEQQKRITSLQQTTNMAVQAIQEHISVLNQRLDVVKAHLHEKVIVQGQTLQEADAIRAEIAELRKNAQNKRADASRELESILTEQQRELIQRMRRGEVVRDER